MSAKLRLTVEEARKEIIEILNGNVDAGPVLKNYSYNCRICWSLWRLLCSLKTDAFTSVTEVMDRQCSFPQPGQIRLSQSKKESTRNLLEKPQAAQPIVTSSFIASSSIKNVSSDLYYILHLWNSKEWN